MTGTKSKPTEVTTLLQSARLGILQAWALAQKSPRSLDEKSDLLQTSANVLSCASVLDFIAMVLKHSAEDHSDEPEGYICENYLGRLIVEFMGLHKELLARYDLLASHHREDLISDDVKQMLAARQRASKGTH